MAATYKKSIKPPTPRAKPAGAGRFSRGSSPKLSPLKTRSSKKAVLQGDANNFTDFGFGTTGLVETPSIIGMGRNAK